MEELRLLRVDFGNQYVRLCELEQKVNQQILEDNSSSSRSSSSSSSVRGSFLPIAPWSTTNPVLHVANTTTTTLRSPVAVRPALRCAVVSTVPMVSMVSEAVTAAEAADDDILLLSSPCCSLFMMSEKNHNSDVAVSPDMFDLPTQQDLDNLLLYDDDNTHYDGSHDEDPSQQRQEAIASSSSSYPSSSPSDNNNELAISPDMFQFCPETMNTNADPPAEQDRGGQQAGAGGQQKMSVVEATVRGFSRHRDDSRASRQMSRSMHEFEDSFSLLFNGCAHCGKRITYSHCLYACVGCTSAYHMHCAMVLDECNSCGHASDFCSFAADHFRSLLEPPKGGGGGGGCGLTRRRRASPLKYLSILSTAQDLLENVNKIAHGVERCDAICESYSRIADEKIYRDFPEVGGSHRDPKGRDGSDGGLPHQEVPVEFIIYADCEVCGESVKGCRKPCFLCRCGKFSHTECVRDKFCGLCGRFPYNKHMVGDYLSAPFGATFLPSRATGRTVELAPVWKIMEVRDRYREQAAFFTSFAVHMNINLEASSSSSSSSSFSSSSSVAASTPAKDRYAWPESSSRHTSLSTFTRGANTFSSIKKTKGGASAASSAKKTTAAAATKRRRKRRRMVFDDEEDDEDEEDQDDDQEGWPHDPVHKELLSSSDEESSSDEDCE